MGMCVEMFIGWRVVRVSGISGRGVCVVCVRVLKGEKM